MAFISQMLYKWPIVLTFIYLFIIFLKCVTNDPHIDFQGFQSDFQEFPNESKFVPSTFC
jgi:hypothetical protein